MAVFLKSLTVKGFKSFADSTTLDFEPGVTVVVGPNGSGKSNVVDAVAWVLGAQGPRALRSAKMEDVIFAGTPKRPPLGRAEVSLTIDNSAGLLPIDFSEVTITRTLFRSGDSEYAINRVPCRLLDIQELLSDTGVGRQQHVIVSQGNIDAVLNARPEERRLVVEEAAGVLKFRRRKEKAERRLESTEASLVRLQDLLREVRRQLRPLEKQAEAARRYGDVVSELASVRRYLLGRDLVQVESRLASAAGSRRELSDREAESRSACSRLDAEIITAEAEMESVLQRTGSLDLGELASRAEGLRARAAGLGAVIAERRRSLHRTLSSAADVDVIASLEAEASSLADRLSATDGEATKLLPRADELAQAEAQLEDETAAFEAQWGSQPHAPADPAAEVRAELGALRPGLERAAGEMRRLDSREASLLDKTARLAEELMRLRNAHDEVAGEQQRLAVAEADTGREAAAAGEALMASNQARLDAEADFHRWTARAEALAQALHEARARAGVERLADLDGVIGTLLDLVEVDDGFQPAFEAAAGEVLAAVVVDGPASARRALAALQRGSATGAVVPLPPVDGAPGEVPPAIAGTIALRDRVRGRTGPVDRLLDRLLGGAVVVEGGWEVAVDLSLESPDSVIVTRDGDRFSGGLWRTGAAGAGATGAALEEARRQAEATSERASESASAWQAALERADAARDAHLAVLKAEEGHEVRQQATAEALARVEGEQAETHTELESLRLHQDELRMRMERDQALLAELTARLPELEHQAEVEAAAERAARDRLADRTASVARMRRELEVRAAGLEERRAITSRRLREVEDRLQRNRAERDQAADRRVATERALMATEQLLGFLGTRQGELDDLIARVRDARRNESEVTRDLSNNLEQLRRRRSAAERELSELRERISRVEMDQAEARVRLENIVEAIRRDLDTEPESVRGAECPPLPPGTSATNRRVELERELRLMGPINPLALEEHAALQERHEFLEGQLEDVRSARRELAKVIKAVDAEIVEVFSAAYADVADHFEKLFATLFPGGEGRLRLTDPDHLLETGIEIEARPSGKNLRRLSLLSGGERSLAALAFLFGVFRARPSPFYMLDEVEAALDDVNLHRFLDLIHEFREEAQLLIVSHQKRTMEAADSLYGVTMAPGGSSRVVSERVGAPAG